MTLDQLLTGGGWTLATWPSPISTVWGSARLILCPGGKEFVHGLHSAKGTDVKPRGGFDLAAKDAVSER